MAAVDRASLPPSREPEATTAPMRAAETSTGAPRHVAIIMDGNRRWARERGLPEAEGHAAGVEAIRPIVEHAVAARHRGALDLRLQPRELGARRATRSRRSSRCSRRPSATRRPTSSGRASAVRLLGRLDELPRRDPGVDRGGARGDRGRHAA